MQPINLLTQTLCDLADSDHYLFSLNDLSSILPGLGSSAFKALLARAAKKKLLVRICRGIYLYPEVEYPAGLLLFNVAAKIRAGEFNYISLETALSDAGVISQIPMNWITLMSSGRSSVIDCGKFGHIEFIHTKKSIESIASQLNYDNRCSLWRADMSLALQDMKDTKRNMDLVDWEVVDELV
jgi:hypothetical protein